MAHQNALGQPIGAPVPGWTGAAPIPYEPMLGQYCDVVPLTAVHGNDLFDAYQLDQTGALWTYMPSGPFADRAVFDDWLKSCCASRDPLFFCVIDKATSQAIGVASFLRIQPDNGVAEVGYIAFSPLLQRTRMATEAMYLMMAQVLGTLGYRRYEWKCDALNAPSRKAAERLGFSYDGLFKQALVYKGRNRDTAWFSILDQDWPLIKSRFETWLSPSNFSVDGQQKESLNTRR
jgi:RimJ/RimL family protein N-acetyltransferase